MAKAVSNRETCVIKAVLLLQENGHFFLKFSKLLIYIIDRYSKIEGRVDFFEFFGENYLCLFPGSYKMVVKNTVSIFSGNYVI